MCPGWDMTVCSDCCNPVCMCSNSSFPISEITPLRCNTDAKDPSCVTNAVGLSAVCKSQYADVFCFNSVLIQENNASKIPNTWRIKYLSHHNQWISSSAKNQFRQSRT